MLHFELVCRLAVNLFIGTKVSIPFFSLVAIPSIPIVWICLPKKVRVATLLYFCLENNLSDSGSKKSDTRGVFNRY